MIAVLIHAHKNKHQLEILVNALQHPEIKIFLHLDVKAGFTFYNPSVELIRSPLSVTWGSFSQVKALLHSLKQIQQSLQVFDFVHFISGQDFPIKPITSFVNYLYVHKGYSFVHYKRIPEEWPECAVRYQRYYFSESKWLNSQWAKSVFKAVAYFHTRKPPVTVYGGSQWVTLSGEAVSYLLSNSKQVQKITRFLNYCNVADELFVQTVLLNSPLKAKCINDNLRFINWSNDQIQHSDSPLVLTLDDFAQIKSSSHFFARKFDSTVDEQILSKIIAELL